MKHSLKTFDPATVASIESSMWKAYYQHNFARLLLLLFRLIKSQFGTGFIRTARLAYYSAKAAYVFRKKDEQDATQCLVKFFGLVRKSSVEEFDHEKVAQLELRWWQIHRRPKQYDESLEGALAQAMVALYNVPPNAMVEYATKRCAAMKLRDSAVHDKKVTPDWQRIQSKLKESYFALKKTVL